jgi:hypothetical protein
MNFRALLLLMVVIAGCSFAPSEAKPALGVSNGTTMTVTLVVNGQPIAAFPPGAPAPAINVASLPALPWTVEARSPSGRVLTSMTVAVGQVGQTTDPSGVELASGTIGRVDLSCGRLTIWAGDFQPSGPAPDPSAGTVGDCLP